MRMADQRDHGPDRARRRGVAARRQCEPDHGGGNDGGEEPKRERGGVYRQREREADTDPAQLGIRHLGCGGRGKLHGCDMP